jgi:hypothetical protein
MKKILTGVLLLVTCSILQAQQKPSFRDYLEKTNSLVPYPNRIAPHISYAPYSKRPVIPNEKLLLRAGHSRSMTLDNANLYGISPNGNKLYRLQMDNMICIVPDMSQYHMPVVRGSDFGDKGINILSN